MRDTGYDWDEVLPEELQQQNCPGNRRSLIIHDLGYLDFDKTMPVEMHVFCDACPPLQPVAVSSLFRMRSDSLAPRSNFPYLNMQEQFPSGN